MSVIEQTDPFYQLAGEHHTFSQAKRLASQFALSDLPVFITGEVGTGKKQMARAIHHKSRRNSELFITVHCSQSEERLEYELFGAEGALNRPAAEHYSYMKSETCRSRYRPAFFPSWTPGFPPASLQAARRILAIPARKIRSAKIYFTGFTCYAFRSLLYLNEKAIYRFFCSIC